MRCRREGARVDDPYDRSNSGNAPNFDVAPDGRFLVGLSEAGGGGESSLILVRNWVQESTRER